MFPSGDLQLRGKLVLPDASTHGPGPFPAVVIVHGSESYSAVDYYSEPYMYAANGFAALAFDKRGTGESEGKYLQNFHVLSDDVVAAVRWLRTQPGIDGNRIHLAGFSQGGWIAPLAALKDGNIRSVLVGYGVMVPVTGEDRWGYFYALQQKGFGDDAVAAADRVNAVIEDIVDRDENRWSELGSHARRGTRASRGSKACAAATRCWASSPTRKMPLWVLRVYFWWRTRSQGDTPFIDRLYDPVADDAASCRRRACGCWAARIRAHRRRGRCASWRSCRPRVGPVQVRVFPDADHGIIRFVQQEDGERRYHRLSSPTTTRRRSRGCASTAVLIPL